MQETMNVFICAKCGGEDSSFIPCAEGRSVRCIHCKKEVEVKLIKVEQGKALSVKDYIELLQYISKNHAWNINCMKGKVIKYVDATFDFRTNTYFAIKFRGMEDKDFVKVNENRHRDMKKWIYDWLESE